MRENRLIQFSLVFLPARMKFFTGIELYIAAVLPLFDFLLVLNITCIGSRPA